MKNEDLKQIEKDLIQTPNNVLLLIKWIKFSSLENLEQVKNKIKEKLKKIVFKNINEREDLWCEYLYLIAKLKDYVLFDEELKKAVSINSSENIYEKTISLFEERELFFLEEDLCNRFVSSCKESYKAKEKQILFYRKKDIEKAKTLAENAFSILPKEHSRLTVLLAKLEYESGCIEQGRTLFETILAKKAKQTDLWNSYLKEELKIKDINSIRRLFERIFKLSLSYKKKKKFTKMCLEFEKKYGDKDTFDRASSIQSKLKEKRRTHRY